MWYVVFGWAYEIIPFATACDGEQRVIYSSTAL